MTSLLLLYIQNIGGARPHLPHPRLPPWSGICWSLPQNCKNSPHFETQKCTIWHLLKPVSNVQEFTPLWDPKVYNLAFVEAYLKSARIHPTLRLKSIQSGICWSLSQMCKNSPHLETGKSDMSLCSCFCDMSMDQSKAVPTHLHFDRCVCRKIEWIKLNLIAFFPPHSCMQLSKWGLVTTAFDESGCVYQALDWCQTPSGYLFWLTLDYHPSLFAP